MKARIFHIMQYEYHPHKKITKKSKPLLTEDMIKKGLDHKSIKEWAYIAHDCDVYSEKDERDDTTGLKKAGDTKPKHWHVVLSCPNQAELSAVAKWFGVPEQYVDVPKGTGAFLDCVEYLTHESEKEQDRGKYRYDDDLVQANFDWRAKLDKRNEEKIKYGNRNVSLKDKLRYAVLYEGMSLAKASDADWQTFVNDTDKLIKLRHLYLKNMPVPENRLNFYVDGDSGEGKGLLSRAIARSLYPGLPDEEIFFEVGSDGVTFQEYDGQPVIIWNDFTSKDILAVFKNDIGAVYNAFETHPRNKVENIKFGDIKLVNRYHIINSTEPYIEFLKGLKDNRQQPVFDENGLNKLMRQSYRRFPFISHVSADEILFMVNSGFLEKSNDYYEYECLCRLKGNLRLMVDNYKSENNEIYLEKTTQALLPVKTKCEEILTPKPSDEFDDETQKLIDEFGTPLPNYEGKFCFETPPITNAQSATASMENAKEQEVQQILQNKYDSTTMGRIYEAYDRFSTTYQEEHQTNVVPSFETWVRTEYLKSPQPPNTGTFNSAVGLINPFVT